MMADQIERTFDREQASLDSDLEQGLIGPEEHHRRSVGLEREMRDAYAEERERAHERLDEDLVEESKRTGW